jgi:hypothetical protein
MNGTNALGSHSNVRSDPGCDERPSSGDFKPGILLDRQPGQGRRVPLALIGKVFCRVNADNAPIEVGDLLTTSAIPGIAMKAVDPQRAFGAVIGKALKPLAVGEGMIPILIALT